MRCYQYFFLSLALSTASQTRSGTLSLNDCTFSTSTGKFSHIIFCFTVADHWFVSVTTHYLNEQLLSNLTLVEKGALGITTRFVHNHTYQVNNEFTVLCCFSLRGWRVTVKKTVDRALLAQAKGIQDPPGTEALLSKLLWHCFIHCLTFPYAQCS